MPFRRNQWSTNALSIVVHQPPKPSRTDTMPNVAFLHRQAKTCLHIARTCFDLASAERMRHLAGELKAKAAEIEKREADTPHMIGRDGSFASKAKRE